MALAVAPGAKIFMGTGQVRPILKSIEATNLQGCTNREIAPARPEATGGGYGRRCDVTCHASNPENLKFAQRVSAAPPNPLPGGGGGSRSMTKRMRAAGQQLRAPRQKTVELGSFGGRRCCSPRCRGRPRAPPSGGPQREMRRIY